MLSSDKALYPLSSTARASFSRGCRGLTRFIDATMCLTTSIVHSNCLTPFGPLFRFPSLKTPHNRAGARKSPSSENRSGGLTARLE